MFILFIQVWKRKSTSLSNLNFVCFQVFAMKECSGLFEFSSLFPKLVFSWILFSIHFFTWTWFLLLICRNFCPSNFWKENEKVHSFLHFLGISYLNKFFRNIFLIPNDNDMLICMKKKSSHFLHEYLFEFCFHVYVQVCMGNIFSFQLAPLECTWKYFP